MIKRIKLYINNNDKSKKVAEYLEKELIKNNFLMVNDKPELCISVGGDGSFLRMIKDNQFNTDVLYVGINAGTLGFLQEIDVDKTKDFVARLVNDQYKIESINIQETNIKTLENNKLHFYSLNEIVLRNSDLSAFKMDVYVDSEYLENYIGDGLLVSTSTGSTAYNLSLGGAVIYNTLKTLQVTPIAPINNKVYNTLRSTLVIPGDRKITLKPIDRSKDLYVLIDGAKKEISDVDSIETYISDKEIKCLRMEEFHFIKVVYNKLLNKE